MIDIGKLSSNYGVRALDENDADIILQLCRQNTLFYEYTEAEPVREQILDDMMITPPGKDLSDKYYVGFFDDRSLIAVMDLIDGYPEDDIAFIGFFMMDQHHQGKHIGSAIITEVVSYLQRIRRTAVRLAIDKGNPQSTHFWKKNGFEIILETDIHGWPKLVAERKIERKSLFFEEEIVI